MAETSLLSSDTSSKSTGFDLTSLNFFGNVLSLKFSELKGSIEVNEQSISNLQRYNGYSFINNSFITSYLIFFRVKREGDENFRIRGCRSKI